MKVDFINVENSLAASDKKRIYSNAYNIASLALKKPIFFPNK